jgi:hypothetical protein
LFTAGQIRNGPEIDLSFLKPARTRRKAVTFPIINLFVGKEP